MKFVFDVDGTILYSEVDEDGNYKLIGHNKKIVKKINDLYNNGHIIILWTGRHWNHLEITIMQMQQIGLKYHTIVHGKPYSDSYYIDDKAIKPEEFLKLNLT
jgi:hydroxymethylpyrimidine pyrophosphatase-like HAD family hydrolase